MPFEWGGIWFDDSGHPMNGTSSLGVFSPNQSEWLPNFQNASGTGIAGDFTNMGGFVSVPGGGGGGLGGISIGGGGGGLPTGIPGGFSNWTDYFINQNRNQNPSTPNFVQQNPDATKTGPGSQDWLTTVLKLIPGLAPLLGLGGDDSSGGTNPDGTPKTTDPTSGSGFGQLLEALGGLIGDNVGNIGGLYGALQAQKQQEWNNNAKISTLNYLQRLGGNAETQQQSAQDSYLPKMVSEMGRLGGLAGPAQAQTLQGIMDALQGAPGAFNGATPFSRVPGIQSMVDWLGGLQGEGSKQLGGLENTITGGPLIGGQNRAGELSQANNPYAKQLEQLSGILTGGNPYIDQAQGTAAGILGKNPLLPMDQVISMARNEAATQGHNAVNKLRRDLLNRTGVTGPAIASGGQNELFGDLQDKVMQNTSSAVTNAMMGQQGLQEQLFGQGANLFGSAQDKYLQQMLGGAGLLNSNQGNQISALNSLANLAGAQTGNVNAFGNLFNNMSNATLGEGQMLQGVQNFGLNNNQGLYSTLSSLLGLQGQNANNLQQGMFQAAGFPQNTYNQNSNFLQNLASNNVGLFGNPAPVGANSNLFNFMNTTGASGGRS